MIDPGTELGGRYRVVRLLGEGGMGAVYEAEHLALGRRVAVKVLHERYGKRQDVIARFEREARAAAAIGHENIVEVFDFGVHDDVPYMVMEMLRGEGLGERIALGGPLAPEAAARVTGQVLSALAAAHAVGIVHRDLKPENVFLIQRGSSRDEVKLLDFGISKIRRPLDDSSVGAPRNMTQDGILLGTPSYMAPEQWMGRRDIDHRADLFSVGVMLYEMLTGGMPYEGETQGELFLEIVKGETEPPPPSEFAPAVPPALDQIVLRAIRRDRDARFQTAQDFLEALRPHGAAGIEAVATLRHRTPGTPPPRPASDSVMAAAAAASAPTHTSATPPAATTAARRDSGADDSDVALEAARILRPRRGGARSVLVGGAAIAAIALGAVALTRAGGSASGVGAARGPATHTLAAATADVPAAMTRAIADRRTEPQGAASGPSAAPTPTAPAPTAAATPGAADDVRVELRGLPAGAVVRLDGATQPAPVLRIARGSAARTLEIESRGARRALEVRPDRDQVIVVDLAALAPAARPSEPARGSVTVRRGSGAIAARPVAAASPSPPAPSTSPSAPATSPSAPTPSPPAPTAPTPRAPRPSGVGAMHISDEF